MITLQPTEQRGLLERFLRYVHVQVAAAVGVCLHLLEVWVEAAEPTTRFHPPR
jgi:hypothetical protein